MNPFDFPILDDVDVAARRVLLRADLNVPMQGGRVSDTTRIEQIIPGLEYLISKGARVAILSHFGRPKGEVRPELSLKPLIAGLANSLKKQMIPFATDCIGPPAATCMAHLLPGEVALFENVRFHPGEEANDPDFARALAVQGDLYVNDAFSCAHRAHASTTGLARYLPAVMGQSMMAELTALGKILESPQSPVAALVGGSKVSTKLALLQRLIEIVDDLVIGGGMANTFLHARGVEVGASLCEPDLADQAKRIYDQATQAGCKIILPEDVVVAKDLEENIPHYVARIDPHTLRLEGGNLPLETARIFDIGPQSRQIIKARLASCRTILWNGPLGAFETPPFDAATCDIAGFVGELTRQGHLVSIAGGGDTNAALSHAGAGKDFTYLSTAGGAFLEWLEGKDLPGVAALRQG